MCERAQALQSGAKVPADLTQELLQWLTIPCHRNLHAHAVTELARNLLRRALKFAVLARFRVLPFRQQLAAVRLVTGQVAVQALFFLFQRPELFNLLPKADELSPVNVRLLQLPQELLIRFLDGFPLLLPAGLGPRNRAVSLRQCLREIIGDGLQLGAQPPRNPIDFCKDSRIRQPFQSFRRDKNRIQWEHPQQFTPQGAHGIKTLPGIGKNTLFTDKKAFFL